MDEVFLKIKSRNRTTSPAIVRTVAANVVPLPLQKRCNGECGRRLSKGQASLPLRSPCTTLVVSFADSPRQHLHTPGTRTCRLRRPQKETKKLTQLFNNKKNVKIMIQIKAKQQNVSFEKNVEKLAFVLSAHLYNTLDASKVIEEAAKRSGISVGVIKAAWDAAGEVIRTWATEGHNVPLPGLGSMRFGVRSKSVQSVEDVKTSLISARRVIFTPSKEVKEELQATKIAITCFDKDGKIVKRVTSADTNDVEDPEDENGTTNSGNNGSTENGGTQNGGTSGGGNNGGNSGGDGGDDGYN